MDAHRKNLKILFIVIHCSEPVEDETDEDMDHDGANSDQDENSEKGK